MPLDKDIDTFRRVLEEATAAIPEEYFQLPVAGSTADIYRERVYCYELYHQLRTKLPKDFPFTLGGEVDKKGHPLLGEKLKGKKPDLLVHRPGETNRNLLIVEVKSTKADFRGISKDLETFKDFLDEAGYSRALWLVYGASFQSFQRELNKLRAEVEDIEQRLLIYSHESAGEPAKHKEWTSIVGSESR